MNECPVCEAVVDLEHDHTDISGEWVQVVLRCPACGAILVGDMQIENFELDKP